MKEFIYVYVTLILIFIYVLTLFLLWRSRFRIDLLWKILNCGYVFLLVLLCVILLELFNFLKFLKTFDLIVQFQNFCSIWISCSFIIISLFFDISTISINSSNYLPTFLHDRWMRSRFPDMCPLTTLLHRWRHCSILAMPWYIILWHPNQWPFRIATKLLFINMIWITVLHSTCFINI